MDTDYFEMTWCPPPQYIYLFSIQNADTDLCSLLHKVKILNHMAENKGAEAYFKTREGRFLLPFQWFWAVRHHMTQM